MPTPKVALSGAVAGACNVDGRLEMFGVGTDHALWHIWQTAAHSGPWSAWSSLAGGITSEPAVAVNTDGRLEVFVRGNDNALWHIWQTAAHSGPWSAWASLGGGITSDPAVAVNTDGRIEVFARGNDNALWHIWQTAAHSGPWSAWASLAGGITSDPAVLRNSDGRLEVFARGNDNGLWHIWQTVAHSGPWSAWSSLGGIVISPVVYLGLNEQHQQQTEWCWLATTVSITLYYDPASTWTQCLLANKELNQTTCCQNGSSNACNQPGYPNQALTTTGHLASTALGKPSFQTIMNELEAGHPVSINIQWNGGGGHNPATDGYDDTEPSTPTIDIEDPWYGPSTNQDFNTFPGSYNGGASWYASYFTK
jgi:hypothetical protein